MLRRHDTIGILPELALFTIKGKDHCVYCEDLMVDATPLPASANVFRGMRVTELG